MISRILSGEVWKDEEERETAVEAEKIQLLKVADPFSMEVNSSHEAGGSRERLAATDSRTHGQYQPAMSAVDQQQPSSLEAQHPNPAEPTENISPQPPLQQNPEIAPQCAVAVTATAATATVFFPAEYSLPPRTASWPLPNSMMQPSQLSNVQVHPEAVAIQQQQQLQLLQQLPQQQLQQQLLALQQLPQQQLQQQHLMNAHRYAIDAARMMFNQSYAFNSQRLLNSRNMYNAAFTSRLSGTPQLNWTVAVPWFQHQSNSGGDAVVLPVQQRVQIQANDDSAFQVQTALNLQYNSHQHRQ